MLDKKKNMWYYIFGSGRPLAVVIKKEIFMEDKEIYLCIQQVADFLGLKYHHTRKLLLADPTLNCYQFGNKRMWLLSDIVAFQERHLIAA